MDLFWLFIPIALIDSLSVVPLCLVPIAILFGGKRPLLGSFLLILGIFITYFILGVIIALGLDVFFEKTGPFFERLWKHPTVTELAIQIVIGLILITLGYRMVGHRGEKKAEQKRESMTPLQAFMFGVIFTAMGFWGAFPYFAIIDQMLRAHFTAWQMVFYLLWYNFLFVLPLIVTVLIGYAFRKECQTLFKTVESFFDRWGRRFVIALFVCIGLVLVTDGIGWFLGYPLIPVK